MIQISQTTAIILMLITTFGWGSWFQCIKRLRGFPVQAFMLLLYSFAVIIVWTAIAFLKPYYIEGSIWSNIAGQEGLAVLVIVCGAIFSIGMQIHMHAVKHIGLILSTSITATVGMIVSTTVACVVGGVREGTSVALIVLGAATLVCATLCCQVSSVWRDKDSGRAKKESYAEDRRTEIKYICLLVMCACFFSPSYTFGMSKGVRTDLNPEGFPSLICVGLLSIGSFLGTLIFSGTYLTKTKQWKCFIEPGRRNCYLMAFISGFCHYGGNIVHTVAIPVLSMAIAGPMSSVSNAWSYLWGILYGEFKGSKRRTVILLGCGLLLYVIGILIFSMNLYW